MRSYLLLTTLIFGFFGSSDAIEPATWNQWRGPSRDGQLAGATWPQSLRGRLELVWERPHAPSYSGPVVSDDTVFTTETIDKTTERVTAYDLDSGDVAWTRQWPGAMAVPFFAASNGDWIRSTPACDQNHLVILGMRDVLVCLDPKTGDRKWQIDFPNDTGSSLPSFGAVCSPIIDGDAVYVQAGAAVVKVKLSDGEILWQALPNASGMMSSGSFSSPVIASIADQRQLIVQTRTELCGVELANGNVLWKQPIEAFRGMNILTPLVFGDRIFTAAHSGKSQLFEVTRGAEDEWEIKELWQQKIQGYMSSPVLMGDSIYLHMKNQRVASMAIDDGAIRWTSEPFGKYWSMASDGNRILSLDNSGELLLITADPSQLSIVDRMKVANNSWAHLAVQGDRVIVRDLAALKVYRWK